ncbi:MAG: hypothetical protein ABEJ56_05875 [Candidatus Nanohaloarchaea archaeon]
MEEKFGVVVAIGLAFFGIVFVLQNAGGGITLVGETPEEMVFVDRSYGKLGSSNPDDRVVRLGDFTVGEARGDIRAYSKQRATVSDRLLGGEKLKFSYNATQPKTGKISFEVLGRQGKGRVYVKVNGKKIFSESLISGGTPEIDVPRQNLRPGMNSFQIGVSRRSLFGSTKYTLEEVKLSVNDRKFHDYQDNFVIYSYEMEDYLESPLNFNVRNSVKTEPLEVFINGRKVYSKRQVRSQVKVEVTPQNADLHPGSNSIKFETEGEAMYSIENAQITMRYLGNVKRQDILFDFELSNRRKKYASKKKTDERVSFNYQNLLPSQRPVKVELNDFNRTFVPDNGDNTLELPEGTLETENSFSLTTNGTYQINSLRIKSEKGDG